MKSTRTYVDTSVFGGIFDDEFSTSSIIFSDQIKAGEFSIVVSAIVFEEILPAPTEVNSFFMEMLEYAEIIEISQEALDLREAYLNEKIVSPKYSNDALHVAIASVSNCEMIISWNFKHIVHFDKIPLYNAVNILNGFKPINIYSPFEVIRYEEEV
jgi:predicted nucleic acid-binding protein